MRKNIGYNSNYAREVMPHFDADKIRLKTERLRIDKNKNQPALYL